jgi:hypothetical protein
MRSAGVRNHSAQTASVGLLNQRSGGVPSYLLLVLILGLGTIQAARADAAPHGWGSSAGSTTLDDEDKWIDEFLEILRRLYKALGGDPNQLGNSPAFAMTKVTLRITLFGVPNGITPEQTAAMLTDIETLLIMLQDPPSSVVPGPFSTVLAGLAALLEAGSN